MTDKIIYDETELLKRVAESDEAAFRNIFDHYRNKIFSIAYKFLKNEDSAEDAVQEVFVKLWINRKQLSQIGNFNAYTNTITRNYLLNELKMLGYAEKFSKQQKDGKTQHDLVTAMDNNELNRRLAQAIYQLPPQQRKVFQLGKVEGLKYDEIACQLKISKETVKTHMSGALRSVKEYLLQSESITPKLIALMTLENLFSFFFLN